MLCTYLGRRSKSHISPLLLPQRFSLQSEGMTWLTTSVSCQHMQYESYGVIRAMGLHVNSAILCVHVCFSLSWRSARSAWRLTIMAMMTTRLAVTFGCTSSQWHVEPWGAPPLMVFLVWQFHFFKVSFTSGTRVYVAFLLFTCGFFKCQPGGDLAPLLQFHRPFLE